jgi:transcriptional regulator with XRE-family HTH domain
VEKTAGTQFTAKRSAKINAWPVHNRIFAVMMHTNRYAFKAQARLAADCGVAPSTISRLLTGQCSPSFALIAAVTAALEKQLKISLDPRELVSRNGDYPTPFTCELCHCRGCLPDEAYDAGDRLRPEYRNVRPGQWTTLSSQFVKQALEEQEAEEKLSNARQREGRAMANKRTAVKPLPTVHGEGE